MRIKNFHIYYGGFFDGHTTITKKGKDLIYFSGIAPIESFGKIVPDEAIRICPNEQQWKSFLESIKPFAVSWKKEYWTDICDGTQWEVKIVTEEFCFKCSGSNDYPDDFDEFMKIVRDFTGIHYFARGNA